MTRDARFPAGIIALALLGACGREDSIWTGASGVVLFILIAWAAIHFIKKD